MASSLWLAVCQLDTLIDWPVSSLELYYFYAVAIFGSGKALMQTEITLRWHTRWPLGNVVFSPLSFQLGHDEKGDRPGVFGEGRPQRTADM